MRDSGLTETDLEEILVYYTTHTDRPLTGLNYQQQDPGRCAGILLQQIEVVFIPPLAKGD